MRAEDFLQSVLEIAEEEPVYRLRGTGTDGTCDCIGLIMGAMSRIEQQKFALHSTNFFARKRMATLEPVQDADIVPGMIVYKARQDAGTLNERYKNGGEYDTGDRLDYYHAGVIESVEPLRIVHCTSSEGVNGITRDHTLKGWTHAGKISEMEWGKGGPETMTAYVQTADGKPLRMRPSPSTEKPYIAKLPNGSSVEVLANAEGWAKVQWQGLTGYCMSMFLQGLEAEAAEGITLTMSREAAQELMNALKKAMGI